MDYGSIFKKIPFIKKEPEEIKILFFYRYTSLLGTSFFYFISDSNHTIQRRLFIILCLTLSSMILTYLYVKNQNSSQKIGALIFIETISNSIMLIPSGGLSSPYVWYALNTILIAAIKLNLKYCWINLSVYLFVSTGISYFMFHKGEVPLINLIIKESNLILSFILITAAMGLLSKYLERIQTESKNLLRTNTELLSANKKIRESMEQTMALYQAIHSFSNQKNRDKLIKLLVKYTGKITKANTIFFYGILNKESDIVIEGDNISEDLTVELKNKVYDKWNNILDSKIPIEISAENRSFIVIAVKSTYKTYGLLGIETTANGDGFIYKENKEQLKFLSELSSIVLERFNLEEVNEGLLINEEQNRIANEIHDSVLQRLFSMSCGVFALMKNVEKINTDQIREELNHIRRSTDNAMKELRSTIYGLSWNKDGINTFETGITEYINEIKRLNNTEIDFKVLGNHELLSSRHKKALYRIICEGIGNAIRHGNASSIDITLNINVEFNLLEITDNGMGFSFDEVMDDGKEGLGLKNIGFLAYSLNGEIDIDSGIGEGTKIRVTIPNDIHVINKEEEAV